MRAKYMYLVLCVLGTVLPLLAFVGFFAQDGAGPRLFLRQLFANPVSGFFGMDVIVSALAVFTFAYVESRRSALRRAWAPIAATLLVGVSLGLPLLLYLRELQLSRARMRGS